MNQTTTNTASINLAQLDKLEALARAATPQNLDSAEDSTKPQGFTECPHCGGEGTVELTADYCNYDSKAMGVQFYGIGPEHQAAEAFFRAANPATVQQLIALARRSLTSGSPAEQDECRMCNGSGIVGFPPDQYEECPDCIAARSAGAAAKTDHALDGLPTGGFPHVCGLLGESFGSCTACVKVPASAAGAGSDQFDWMKAERISNEDHVDEALRAFSEDPTADNATGVIQAALTVWTADVRALDTSVTVQDERALFEATMPQAYPRDRNMPDKSYNSPFLHNAWQGWQARAALAQRTGNREGGDD